MAVKIRLKRFGKIRSPHYRIVVADSRTKRDGRAIEEIGKYHPKNDPSLIEVDSERAQYWLSVGAQPSEAVVALLKRTGDWQKFSGDTSPSGVEPQPEKPNKTAAFNAALAEMGERAKRTAATTAKKAAAKQAAATTPDPGSRALRPRPSRRPTRALLRRIRPRADVLADALEHLVRGIVSNPDDVTVQGKGTPSRPDARGPGQSGRYRQGDRAVGPHGDCAAHGGRRAGRPAAGASGLRRRRPPTAAARGDSRPGRRR